MTVYSLKRVELYTKNGEFYSSKLYLALKKQTTTQWRLMRAGLVSDEVG